MVKVGVNLDLEGDAEKAGNRKAGIGSLMGYVTGPGVSILYGALRVFTTKVPIPVAGSDVPSAALGVSDPRTRNRVDWHSDAVSPLGYGIFTAIACGAFTRERTAVPSCIDRKAATAVNSSSVIARIWSSISSAPLSSMWTTAAAIT
jgi:hypothetical protein